MADVDESSMDQPLRVFGLHYITDPSMARKPKEMYGHFKFLKARLQQDEMDIISSATMHYQLLCTNVGSFTVIIDQWLYLVLLMRRRLKGRMQLQLTITPWSQFLTWLMSATGREFEEWHQYNLVLGLVNYSTEYICDHTGITVENVQEFDARMMDLAEYLCLWPPLYPLRGAACKWNTIRRLDMIARYVTRTNRPTTTLWDRVQIKSDKVYKRCYSGYHDHIYYPTEGETKPTVPALLESSRLPGRHWMEQEWIRHLRDFGEFRIYFVKSKIVHIAFARYVSKWSRWYYIVPASFYTLDQFRDIILGEPQPLAMFRAGKNDAGTAAGRAQLEQFATTTLHALVYEERAGPDGTSTLAELCRMDVGLMVRDGECNFCVSEIERTFGLDIFGEEGIPPLAHSLAAMLILPDLMNECS